MFVCILIPSQCYMFFMHRICDIISRSKDGDRCTESALIHERQYGVHAYRDVTYRVTAAAQVT